MRDELIHEYVTVMVEETQTEAVKIQEEAYEQQLEFERQQQVAK